MGLSYLILKAFAAGQLIGNLIIIEGYWVYTP